jgi:ribose-phosphate pyrophosphokinase
MPQVEKFKNHTPVLVDDIISTAHTMIEAVDHLKKNGMKYPVCIGVHAVFAGGSFKELKNSGAQEIITCNTIPHESNGIDISELIVSAIKTQQNQNS